MGTLSVRHIWICSVAFLLSVVLWRTVAHPYTKVEESFTIQAVHDILIYGTRQPALAHYDHQVFAGAVPRSFIGPWLLAMLSYPCILMLDAIGVLHSSTDIQLVVRLVLAIVNAFALIFFGSVCFRQSTWQSRVNNEGIMEPISIRSTAVKTNKSTAVKRTGNIPSSTTSTPTHKDGVTSKTSLNAQHTETEALFLFISACQFHFAFWCSRTIPNSLALPCVLSALALIVRNLDKTPGVSKQAMRDYQASIFLLTFGSVTMRLELIAMLAPVGLYLLSTRRLTLLRGVVVGLQACVTSVVATTLVDTYFWQNLQQENPRGMANAFVHSVMRMLAGNGRPLWPELEAVLFNVVQGKSSEWGVSPWHAYVTAFLPKLLGFAIFLVPFGLFNLNKKSKFLLIVTVTHMAILSLLGHKEWRFVVYCLPAFNCVAATGAKYLTSSRLGLCLVVVLLIIQMSSSELMAYISGLNYPGGVALSRFHDAARQLHMGPVNLHIDVLPAMTGVTLFQSEYLDRNGTFLSFPAHARVYDYWTYNKTENIPTEGAESRGIWLQYTHLLTERSQCKILHTLSDEEQPFEPMSEPVQSYAGLRPKQLSVIRQDVVKTLSNFPLRCTSLAACSKFSSEAFRLLLPVEILQEDAVWLCRRKTRAN